MAANRKKQDDKNIEILRELTSLNCNKYCLDCNQRGPTYVNTTIGSFVCTKCSGMLRGLTPPHRVKSISMATFSPEEIEFVKSRGNEYCRRVWLGLFDGESSNFKDEQKIRDFMSDKYEKKRYYIEPTVNINGNSDDKIGSYKKAKSKNNRLSSNNQAPLISINASPESSISNKMKSAMPTNTTYAQPDIMNNNHVILSNTPLPAVTEFPVDFTNANIYNSSQPNNSFHAHSDGSNFANFSAFSQKPQVDKYAALADLDLELKQKSNDKKLDECAFTSNPFQTEANTLINKNPFYDGGWGVEAKNLYNPFTPSANGAGSRNSKNPFL